MPSMTWFDSAVERRWSSTTPHRSSRRVSAVRAAPIARRSCIWFCMSSRRSCWVLQMKREEKTFVIDSSALVDDSNVTSSPMEELFPDRDRAAVASEELSIKTNLSALRWS